MSLLLNIATAPFKIVAGTINGVKDAADTVCNANKKSDAEVIATLWSFGLYNVVKGSYKGTKDALDDITDSKKIF